MAYPSHYHAACNALIDGREERARAALAYALRCYRRAGQRHEAREMLGHAAWVGFPVRLRPNGRYR